MNPDEIARLLDESRQQHQIYRENVPRRIKSGDKTVAVDGDPVIAGAALLAALRARTEAHALDPEQQAPAWTHEPVTHDHDALLTFYAEQLGR